MTGKWKKRLGRIALACGALFVVGAIWGWSCFRHSITRFYGFGTYVYAFSSYVDEYHQHPQTLEALRAYSLCCTHRHYDLEKDGIAPVYRPVLHSDPAPRLVMVEKPPPWWARLDRFVHYACTDVECTAFDNIGTKNVWFWEVDDLIAEDDRAREAVMRASGQAE